MIICVRFSQICLLAVFLSLSHYHTRTQRGFLPSRSSDHCANIVLWSIVESGVGITACSLPALKRLLKRHFQFDATDDKPPGRGTPFDGLNRATITTNTTIGSRPTRTASAPWGDGLGWEHLDDVEMGRQIFIKVDLERQSTERRTRSCGSRGSGEELVPSDAGHRRHHQAQ